MADLKEYLVASTDNKVFIVAAKDAKEAIDYVYNNHYARRNREWLKENAKIGFAMNRIYTKADFSARSIGSLHTEHGRMICIKKGRCFND